MQVLDVIYCYEGRAWEEQWWAAMLGDFEVRIHRGAGFSLVMPDALYMIDGAYGMWHAPAEFLEKVSKAGQPGLLHFGDEFARGPYEVYASFAYVIRQQYKPFLNSPGVLSTPVGYTNDCTPPSFPKASERPYLWAFTGSENHSRRKFVAHWKGVEPSFVKLVDLRAGQKHLSREQFLQLMRDSVFAPCPMGNVHVEVGRAYEALENGSIPLLTKRRAFPEYWGAVLGKDHPLPSFYNWTDARAYVEKFAGDKAALDALQAKIDTWWKAEKLSLRTRTKDHILAGQRGEFRAALQRDFSSKSGIGLQVPRMVDFVRHHDYDALMGRAGIFYRRLTGKIAWQKGTPGRL